MDVVITMNNEGGENIQWKLIHSLLTARNPYALKLVIEIDIALLFATLFAMLLWWVYVHLWLLSDIGLNGINNIHLFVACIQIIEKKGLNCFALIWFVSHIQFTCLFAWLFIRSNAMQLWLLRLCYSLFWSSINECLNMHRSPAHAFVLYLLITLKRQL